MLQRSDADTRLAVSKPETLRARRSDWDHYGRGWLERKQASHARASSGSLEVVDTRRIEGTHKPDAQDNSSEPGWPSGHQNRSAGSTQISHVRQLRRCRVLTIEFGRRLAGLLSARHVGHPITLLRGQRTHLIRTDVVADRL